MDNTDKTYCLLFKDPTDSFKWTREFFNSKEEADRVLAQLPKEAEAFFRQCAVVSAGGKSLFFTRREAEIEEARLKGMGESPAITIFNPNFPGSPDLLYTELPDNSSQ